MRKKNTLNPAAASVFGFVTQVGTSLASRMAVKPGRVSHDEEMGNACASNNCYANLGPVDFWKRC